MFNTAVTTALTGVVLIKIFMAAVSDGDAWLFVSRQVVSANCTVHEKFWSVKRHRLDGYKVGGRKGGTVHRVAHERHGRESAAASREQLEDASIQRPQVLINAATVASWRISQRLSEDGFE